MNPNAIPKTRPASTPRPTSLPIDFSSTFASISDRVLVARESPLHPLSWSPASPNLVPRGMQWLFKSSTSSSPFDHDDQYHMVGGINMSVLLLNLTASTVTLDLARLNQSLHQQQMVLNMDWQIDHVVGSSQSPVFTVINSRDKLSESVKMVNQWVQEDQEAATGTSQSSQQPPASTPTSVPENTISSSQPAVSHAQNIGTGTHLAAGAIAGIAIGSTCGLLVIIGLVYLMLQRRRRRRQNASTNATHLYMQDKGLGAAAPVVDSLQSPVSDSDCVSSLHPPHGAPGLQGSHASSTAEATGATPPMRDTSPSRERVRSFAHLIEEGMTPDEIRHLEEEERQLDIEIERASRR
ncbi:hypothetical protein CDD82_2523 [Ophiocordyceps australis]|uniref:Mid2 domain-containing protein n=1 Tax=Ophiocordyceps australis TaxID=1399860 RepID=A0A2C5XRY8_9HYPO|nr:hypothetical protein CDD82_2523 [Ophiocordyceps australis]